MSYSNNSLEIVCASGDLKAIFVHRVLSAFESAKIEANAYAAASASTMPNGFDKGKEFLEFLT